MTGRWRLYSLHRAAGGLLVALTLALAACSGSDADDGTIAVTATDYAFDGMPATVASGSALALVNESDGEVHELAVARIADGEVLTVDELVALPVEEMQTLMWFQGTLVALPGEDGVVPGDTATTTLPVEEPGRYLLLCLIPQGADVAVAEAALEGGAAGEPLDLGDGELHARLGMVAEFTVE